MHSTVPTAFLTAALLLAAAFAITTLAVGSSAERPSPAILAGQLDEARNPCAGFVWREAHRDCVDAAIADRQGLVHAPNENGNPYLSQLQTSPMGTDPLTIR